MIRQWADEEMAPWRDSQLDYHGVDAGIGGLASARPSVYIFAIDQGRVYLDDKQTWPGSQFPADDIRVTRAYGYLRFFQDCCDAIGIRGSGRFVFDMEDLTGHELNMPMFCFQKTWASRNLLLPDVDFLHNDFYSELKYEDAHAFDVKRPGAVFVGSTTGDVPLTARHIAELTSARVRAAVRFRDHPDIRFDLPNIVQCDSDETRRLIVELGVTGQPATWREQLAYRYMISIDGNGATCARVYGALVSNSVLLKYRSDHQLFFFKGMKPWQHFVPIGTEADVERVIAEREMNAPLHRRIAAEGKAFAERSLSRIRLMEYTAELLGSYLARFGRPIEQTPAQERAPFLFDLLVHVSHGGNIWAKPGGWARDEAGGNPIEGFRIDAGGDCAGGDIVYRGYSADGTPTAPTHGHAYCGTKGQSRPLHGVDFDLSAVARAKYELLYEAAFADGTTLSGSTGMRLFHDSPLVALRIGTRARLGAEQDIRELSASA